MKHDSAELARQARIELRAGGAPPQTRIAIEELLEKPTDPGHEREHATGPRLGELVEVVSDKGLLAPFGVHETGATWGSEGGGVDRVDRIAHRRPVGVGAR